MDGGGAEGEVGGSQTWLRPGQEGGQTRLPTETQAATIAGGNTKTDNEKNF